MGSTQRNKSSSSGEDDLEMVHHHRCHSSCESERTDSLCFSDAEDHLWQHSPNPNSTNNSPPSISISISPPQANNVAKGPVPDPCRKSCVSDCSLETDLESGVVEPEINKASPEKWEKNCRICHLSIELEGSGPETDTGIVLGCSCKDDLAASHRQCAETWFKIKGNKTCEICGSTARNVIGSGSSETELMEQWNESNNNNATNATSTTSNEPRRFWQGHRFLNFLLACMVFAFVISWLFHFNVPG